MSKPTLADFQRTIALDPAALELTPEEEAREAEYQRQFRALLQAPVDTMNAKLNAMGLPDMPPARLFVGFGGRNGVARLVSARKTKEKKSP